jgi:hypothetical protein
VIEEMSNESSVRSFIEKELLKRKKVGKKLIKVKTRPNDSTFVGDVTIDGP